MAVVMYKSAVLEQPNQLTIQTRKIPELQPNEVLVRMQYAGVCGTDIAIYSGDYPVLLPLVLGHEFSGIVEMVGSSDHAYLLNKPVTAEINNTCIAYKKGVVCSACRKGLTNHCLTRTVLGIIKYDGAFAEFVKIPVGNIHILPEEIDLQSGIFVEPLAAAFRTFELAPLVKGDTIVILGIGRLGRLLLAVTKEYPLRVIVVVRNEKALDKIKPFQPDFIFFSESDDLVNEIKQLTDGLGADLVIESTGSPAGFSLAQDLVRPQGIISLKTTCGLPAKGINSTKLVVDEIRVQGSRCGPFKRSIHLLQKNKDSITSIISDILPLQDTEKAIQLAKTHPKIIISNN